MHEKETLLRYAGNFAVERAKGRAKDASSAAWSHPMTAACLASGSALRNIACGGIKGKPPALSDDMVEPVPTESDAVFFANPSQHTISKLYMRKLHSRGCFRVYIYEKRTKELRKIQPQDNLVPEMASIQFCG